MPSITNIWNQFGRNCRRPTIQCKCCNFPAAGFYDKLSNTMTICWNEKMATDVAMLYDLQLTLIHEAVHALQGCYDRGDDGLCNKAIRWELEAYWCEGACKTFDECMRVAMGSICWSACSPDIFNGDKLSELRAWWDNSHADFCSFPRSPEYPDPNRKPGWVLPKDRNGLPGLDDKKIP